MKILDKLFHRHSWRAYKTVPEYGISYNWGLITGSDGTAVFYKCKCGERTKKWFELKYKIIDGFLVHNL